MADDLSSEAPSSVARCPWCSAVLASAGEVSCPSCGATLILASEHQVPGVTAIDAEAIVRAARAGSPPRRSRLLSWISGEPVDDEPDAPNRPESLAPPPPEVAREMLRMELEAVISDLEAEAGAFLAEEATGGGAEAPPAVDGMQSNGQPEAVEPEAPIPPPEKPLPPHVVAPESLVGDVRKPSDGPAQPPA